MKLKVLLISVLFFNLNINAQTPCVPGMYGYQMYSLDLDNDGYTSFDITYYDQNNLRPELENTYQNSSSGYNMEFRDSNYIVQTSPYTNSIPNEMCYFNYIYSGSGVLFQQTPPITCYQDLSTISFDVTLVAVPFDGDNDNDGISNRNEDSNNNLNLMDDDDDNDGTINLLDPTVLSKDAFENLSVRIFPNPTSNGIINFESDLQLKEVTLYDLTGKTLINRNINSNVINLNPIDKGVYLLKLKSSDDKTCIRKIIIN